MVLFTNKDEVPALFRILALAFRDRMHGLAFGWLRAHDEDNEVILRNMRPQKVGGEPLQPLQRGGLSDLAEPHDLRTHVTLVAHVTLGAPARTAWGRKAGRA